MQMIVQFLRQQQSPDWRSTQALDTAAGDFRDAMRWLRKRDWLIVCFEEVAPLTGLETINYDAQRKQGNPEGLLRPAGQFRNLYGTYLVSAFVQGKTPQKAVMTSKHTLAMT